MENPRNNIDDLLLAKYLDGSSTELESIEVESWIASSNENRKEYDLFKNIWIKSQGVEFNSEIVFDKKAAFQRVLTRIEKDSDVENPIQKSPKSFAISNLIARMAAVLLIGIVTYFAYQYFLPTKVEEVQITATSGNMEILLPDSSVIYLHSEGNVKYAENFIDNRILTLSGEAFFEVNKQMNTPFIVRANGLEVKVLGTSFYIIAIENDSLFEVGVKTGKVEVAQLSDKKSIILVANEMMKYNKIKHTFSQTEVYNPNKLFWKTAVLEFNDQPLDQVLSTLSQVYDTEIIFQKSELENCNFTGRFKNAGLEEILNQLQASINIEVTMNEKVLITGKACHE